MARIPGIYVSIQGDVTQLNADLGKARKMVKEAADDISNALGNALKPNQITSGLSSMVTKLNELSNYSKTAGVSFSGLGVNLGELTRLTGQSEREFAELQSRFMERQAITTAERALTSLSKSLNLNKTEVAELGRQYQLSEESIKKVATSLGQTSSLLGGKSFGDILKNTFAYGSAYQLLGVIQQLPGELIKVVAQLDSLKASFNGVFGAQGPAQFEYAIDVANKYGKSIDSVAAAYKKFAAATEYVGLSSDKTKTVFESVTQAVTKVGGTSEDVSGTLLALQQMISKGTVSAEEFRLQFAERIPGAMKMGADALGVTTSKFKSMMENGEVIATDFIPKLASQLEKFSQGWQSAAGSIESNWERIKNSVMLASDSFFQVFISSSDIKDLEKRVAQAVDVVNAGLKKIKPKDGESGYVTQAVKAAFSVTPLGRVAQYDSQYFPKADTSNTQQLETLKAEAQKLSSEIADILAKPADISPESGKRVQELQDKLNETLKTIHTLCDQNWQANFTANVDTSQLERAVALIDTLYKKSAQGGVATAAAQLKTVQAGAEGLQDQLNQLDAKIKQAEGSSPIVNSLLKQRLSVESELKKTGAAINEAKANYLESLKRFSKEEAATPFGDLNRKSSGDTKVAALAKEAEDYEKRKAQATARYEEDQRNSRTISATEYDAELKRLAADHNAAITQIEKQHNRGTNAAAHHAVAVEKLNDTLDNYLAKQMGLASDDTLGAKFADIAAKADNLRAKARDLAIAGGVDLATAFKKIDDAVTAARDAAGDDLIEKLFPWVKKENSLQTGFEALYKHYDDLSAAAKRAGMSMDDVKKLLNDKQVFVNYTTQLKAIKDKLDTTFNFAEYKANFDKLSDLQYQDNGSKEKESWEELLKTYNEVTGKMYRLKAGMYDRILEKARATGMDEAHVQAILAKQTEESTKQMLEAQVQYASTFNEMFSSKWSLAFGSYKNGIGRTRDEWAQWSDNAISLTQGMISSVSGGFSDFFRKMAEGTATVSDLWQYMCNRMLDATAQFVEKVLNDQLSRVAQALGGSLGGVFSGLFGGASATSGATINSAYNWGSAITTPFAKGGTFPYGTSLPLNSVISSPTYFSTPDQGWHAYANGGVLNNVVGEAGRPEGILPLAEVNGGLGVYCKFDENSNKSNQNITFNIQNRTGKEVSLSTAKTAQTQDGMVVTMLLDLVGRNVGGLRTGLQSALGAR